MVAVAWHGTNLVDLAYRRAIGQFSSELLTRDDEARLEVVEEGRAWSFDADAQHFR